MLYFTRLIFLHRRQAKSFSWDDGRLLSLNPVSLCNSLWPKQASGILPSHAFWKTAGNSTAPGAMPMHEELTRRLILYWVLLQCAPEIMDHSCSTPIPGQASNNSHGAAPKALRGGRESGDSPSSSQGYEDVMHICNW